LVLGIFYPVTNSRILLSYIQTIVDTRQRNGQFVLTGSHQLALREAITQSLTNAGLFKLLPDLYWTRRQATHQPRGAAPWAQNNDEWGRLFRHWVL